MPAGARKQLAQSQNTAKADPADGDDAKSDGILASLRVYAFADCPMQEKLDHVPHAPYV